MVSESNVCRSVLAEAIMKQQLADCGLGDMVQVQSKVNPYLRVSPVLEGMLQQSQFRNSTAKSEMTRGVASEYNISVGSYPNLDGSEGEEREGVGGCYIHLHVAQNKAKPSVQLYRLLRASVPCWRDNETCMTLL